MGFKGDSTILGQNGGKRKKKREIPKRYGFKESMLLELHVS
jgi:hypothetical protein